jgi:hypothetical protein
MNNKLVDSTSVHVLWILTTQFFIFLLQQSKQHILKVYLNRLPERERRYQGTVTRLKNCCSEAWGGVVVCSETSILVLLPVLLVSLFPTVIYYCIVFDLSYTMYNGSIETKIVFLM